MTEGQFQVGLLQVGLLLDELPDLVLLVDSEGTIRYANQRCKEQLNKTDLLGTSFRELVDERDLERFPKQPQDWINWQGSDDSSWELTLTIEERSQLVSGKARLVSLPTRLSTIFEGVLVVLRLVDLTNQPISQNLLPNALSVAIESANISMENDEPFAIERRDAPIVDDNDQVAYWAAEQQNVTRRRQLEKKILDAQTYEQERIARDLHDSVQQRINVVGGLAQLVRLKLGSQLSPEIDCLLTKLFESSQQAASEIRLITHGLNSISSDKDGLMRALQQLADTTQEIFKANCEFTYEQPVPINDHEKADHLYRLAQEAVNNAIRHGRAKQISIGFSRQAPGRYTLTISDDGCGISQTDLNLANGIGLNSMRYRAAAIGADFAIAPSDKGSGTVVTCTFACLNNQKNKHPKPATQTNFLVNKSA